MSRNTDIVPACWTHRKCSGLCVLLTAACAMAGCMQEMADQPRVDVYQADSFFTDGMSARPQVAGTVSRDQPVQLTPAITGRQDGKSLEQIPVELTQELLERGQQRFGIMCVHCHGPSGYGDGMVVQRGFPAPPSYHTERLRSAPDGHLFAVITDGLGRMPALGRRITPSDRWAITAYVRALQLSQNAGVDSLPERDRSQLNQLSTNSEPQAP